MLDALKPALVCPGENEIAVFQEKRRAFRGARA